MAVRPPFLATQRLRIRSWEERHRAPFQALSADAETMRHLSPLPDRASSDAWIDRQRGREAVDGFCFWAVERQQDDAFIGAIGLLRVPYEAHFTPAVEVGWRVARPFWGLGYATEAAEASLGFGFETLGLTEIVANTAVENAASQRVMAKLGMARDPADDFDHPRLPIDSRLRRQVLYRIGRSDWQRMHGRS